MPRFIIRQKAQSSHGDVPSASLAFFLQQDSSSLLKPNTSLSLCITLLLSDGFHADEHEEGSVLGEQEVEEDETEQRGGEDQGGDEGPLRGVHDRGAALRRAPRVPRQCHLSGAVPEVGGRVRAPLRPTHHPSLRRQLHGVRGGASPTVIAGDHR
ncbi:hypothetical protein HPP92_020615 [Vanilla planifolia]|uniref:Uncharacterized protein n=1 Tax=Vanilla planifolia TaxID=51239 RepID=A0A835PYE4_VANPL|nr:hypothetical protein HPP92_020615 [Vanilla planifolia]